MAERNTLCLDLFYWNFSHMFHAFSRAHFENSTARWASLHVPSRALVKTDLAAKLDKIMDGAGFTHPERICLEFAKWLSSNIYAGAYKTGTVGNFVGSADTTLLNDGLPYLTCTQLARYDLDSYFSLSHSMMLSIWNVEESGASSYLNGVFALNDLDFKYFKSIVTHQLLRFDMSILPADIGYEIHSRVYGLSASYTDDVQDGVLGAGQANVKDHPLGSDGNPYEIAVDATGVKEPNLVVVTIKLKKISENYPWGVYREWSAP